MSIIQFLYLINLGERRKVYRTTPSSQQVFNNSSLFSLLSFFPPHFLSHILEREREREKRKERIRKKNGREGGGKGGVERGE